MDIVLVLICSCMLLMILAVGFLVLAHHSYNWDSVFYKLANICFGIVLCAVAGSLIWVCIYGIMKGLGFV